jgi:hypothetical protein
MQKLLAAIYVETNFRRKIGSSDLGTTIEGNG